MFTARGTQVVNLLVETTPDAPIDKVFLSPDWPDTAIVLFANGPPRFYDLVAAGLPELVFRVDQGHVLRTAALSLTSDHLIGSKKMRFTSPCVYACYRPGQADDDSEVALVFAGEEESTTPICRINPRSGKPLGPADVFNATCCAYSHDGNLLLTGGNDGRILLFGLLKGDSDDPREVWTGQIKGGVRALCLEGHGIVRAASEFNSMFKISVEDSAEGVRQCISTAGDSTQVNMHLNTLVWNEGYGLLAYAGASNDLWLQNPETGKGFHVQLKRVNNVRSLQFVEDTAELLVFGDGGIELLPFAFRSEGREPYFENKICLCVPDDSPEQPIVGVHQYGNLMCVVSSVTA